MEFPPNTPLTEDQKKQLDKLVSGLQPQQVLWVGKYLEFISSSLEDVGGSAKKVPLTILYGSESGNAAKLSNDLKKAAGKAGFGAKVIEMFDAQPADLEKFENLIIVVSTWGEGDPPERAVEFVKEFKSAKLNLNKTNFAVLALGDTAYVDFCAMGKLFDEKLAEFGGKKLFDRVDCDVSFEKPAAAWIEGAVKKFAEVNKVEPAKGGMEIDFDFGDGKTYSPDQPFTAKVKEKLVLNGTGSDKETWHVEIDLEGSGLKYTAGDALGVVPENDNELVELVLKNSGIKDDKFAKELKAEYELQLTKPVVEKYAAATNAKIKGDINEYIYGRDLADLLADYPAKGITADQLRGILRPLPPRLYSIASSNKFVSDEVHLTIAAVRYESNGRGRKGVASTFIADAIPKNGDIKIYLKPNKNFRLPAPDVPVIMVGPGTGIAPFRAFAQARESQEAKGKSWLFFGDQHYNFDFLYQLEWQDWLKSGILSKLNVAFSRDGVDKVYVQHKMWEEREELWKWLEQGAYFYVCGDEKRMAKDVDAMLKKIVSEVGKKDGEEYISQLKKQNRYQRDVY